MVTKQTNSPNEVNYQQFTDEKGNIYTAILSQPIGKGGQGEVLRVAEDRYLAIKRSFTSTPEEKTAIQKNIKLLRYLPIPHNARISMPIAFLKDEAGFVMRLLEKMQPLTDLMPNCIATDQLRNANLLPNNQIPTWLNPKDESVNDPDAKKYNDPLRRFAYFAYTGGLKARLSWLLQLTELLELLHKNNLIFADLSPNNIYITSGSKQQVWLIDVDNISYESKFNSFVETPNYGAPEIVNRTQGTHNTIMSDLFSFALIAFETLCMYKPFDVPYKTQSALNNSLDNDINSPWIFDSQDASGRTNNISQLVKFNLTLPLLNLFSQTFELGRYEPSLRPPIWLWHKVLQNTLDLTVKCHHCGMSVIYSEISSSNCEFCQQKLEVIAAYRENLELVFAHELSFEKFDIPKHLFTPCLNKEDNSCLCVYFKDNCIHFRLSNNDAITFFKITKGQDISLLDNNTLEQNRLIKLDMNNPYFELNINEYVNYDLVLILDNEISWPIRLILRSN